MTLNGDLSRCLALCKELINQWKPPTACEANTDVIPMVLGLRDGK